MMVLPFIFAPTSSPPTNFALLYLYNESRCNEYFDNLKVKNEKKKWKNKGNGVAATLCGEQRIVHSRI